MSEIKWIKITTGMFEDDKFDFIYTLPDADSIIIVWIRLLTLAGRCNAGGYVMLTENIPYTEEMLSEKFKKPLNTIKLAFQTFSHLGMIEKTEDGEIFISNWEKHQNIDGMERIKEQNKLRKQKERERKRLGLPGPSDSSSSESCDMSRDSHGPSQSIHATDIELDIELDIDIDIDKENKEEINNSSPSAVFDTFWNLYPRKAAKKDAESAFKALMKFKIPFSDIMTATTNYVASCRGREIEFIKLPATFLRKERWRDYLECDQISNPRSDGPPDDSPPSSKQTLTDLFSRR